jgi:hypothetical protein
MNSLPTARTDRLLVEELNGEALVYDLDSNIVHHLDHRATQVWRWCDGKTTEATIARRIGLEVTADSGGVVETALRQLQAAGLLLLAKDAGRPLTRREMLTKVGKTAGVVATLQLVTSMAAPTPAMAASCGAKPGPETLHCRWICNDGKWGCTASVILQQEKGTCETEQGTKGLSCKEV